MEEEEEEEEEEEDTFLFPRCVLSPVAVADGGSETMASRRERSTE